MILKLLFAALRSICSNASSACSMLLVRFRETSTVSIGMCEGSKTNKKETKWNYRPSTWCDWAEQSVIISITFSFSHFNAIKVLKIIIFISFDSIFIRSSHLMSHSICCFSLYPPLTRTSARDCIDFTTKRKAYCYLTSQTHSRIYCGGMCVLCNWIWLAVHTLPRLI